MDETLALPVPNPKQSGISFSRGAFLLVNLVDVSRRSYHLRIFLFKNHIFLFVCACTHACHSVRVEVRV